MGYRRNHLVIKTVAENNKLSRKLGDYVSEIIMQEIGEFSLMNVGRAITGFYNYRRKL